MFWLLLAVAVLLLWVSVDLLFLSKNNPRLPEIESDKMLFGESRLPIPAASRPWLRRKILVQSGTSSRVLAFFFALLSLCLVGIAMGWL
jgi:hypothetical protein